jgi:nicotinate-nucleotide adenylyltransferase
MDFEKFHVFFGGTFDPPHIGHDQMLKALCRSPEVGIVHLVPTFLNPLKKTNADVAMNPLGDAKTRQNWIHLWVGQIRREFPDLGQKIQMEYLELESQKQNYTFDTWLKLRSNNFKQKWVLSIGDDQLASFDQWYCVSDLLQSIHSVWVFLRKNRGNISQVCHEIPPALRDKCQFRVMTDEIEAVSSSEIRKIIRLGPRESDIPIRVPKSILDSLGI